jgi:hypothetical protein
MTDPNSTLAARSRDEKLGQAAQAELDGLCDLYRRVCNATGVDALAVLRERAAMGFAEEPIAARMAAEAREVARLKYEREAHGLELRQRLKRLDAARRASVDAKLNASAERARSALNGLREARATRDAQRAAVKQERAEQQNARNAGAAFERQVRREEVLHRIGRAQHIRSVVLQVRAEERTRSWQ